MDRGERGARVGSVADGLLRGDERRDRLLEGHLSSRYDDGRIDAGGEQARGELLPEGLAPGLPQKADRILASLPLLGGVRSRPGSNQGHRGDPLRRLTPQLEREVAAQRGSDGHEVALDEGEHTLGPCREAELEVGSGQVRSYRREAGLLERGSDPVPHSRIERERVQEEDRWTRHGCDASGRMPLRLAPARPPVVAAEAMVATSQPLATDAGLRALEEGGNAADAALAAAAVLCVTEPMSTGLGGDAFALVWDGERLHGLDAAGPAPRAADPGEPVAEVGPRSVTVPGAVAGWATLADRFARLGFDTLLADAVAAAEEGFAVGTITAEAWAGAPTGLGPIPASGASARLPTLAASLRRLAHEGPTALYRGELARAIASCTWLDEADLAAFEPRWVEPLALDYHGVTVCELPPPTQGVAALEGLGLLALGDPTFSAQVECVRLALEDAFERVRDGADVQELLGPAFLARRRKARGSTIGKLEGGTVYLCAVDAGGMAVSLIQSLYGSFGSGIVAPGTGIVLQNRGACFAVSGQVEPGRRPYHTIIPGMLLRDGELFGPFGVMGGFIQAQAHVQLVSALVDEGLDPQAALDRPRFRAEGDSVLLEQGLWDRAAEVEALGLRSVRSADHSRFGGGQAILRMEGRLVGGSDRRKDGRAAGF